MHVCIVGSPDKLTLQAVCDLYTVVWQLLIYTTLIAVVCKVMYSSDYLVGLPLPGLKIKTKETFA